MNFDNMPNLHWRYGDLWALFLMVVIAVGLSFIFKRTDWLSSHER
jgi:magnesium transporter